MLRDHKQRAGFTLIEIMVAVAVLSMISITIWTATSQTTRTGKIITEAHDKYHEVRVAFEMMTRDLQSAFLSQHRALNEPTHDAVFIGRDSGSEDSVDFVSFTHQRRYLDAKESDQCEVGYFLADDKEVSGMKNLIRRESPYLDLEALEGGQYLIIVRDVVSFDLQYFDLPMKEWQDTWDTTDTTEQQAILPYQVRIRIAVHDRLGEEVSYGTQIPIPMRTPIWRQPFLPGPPLQVIK